jgi:sugar lactone lactonase YvrE
MVTCRHGHENTENQGLCRECGEELVGTEAPAPLLSAIAPSNGEVQDETTPTAEVEATTRRSNHSFGHRLTRNRLIASGNAMGLVVVVLVLVLVQSSHTTGPSSRAPQTPPLDLKLKGTKTVAGTGKDGFSGDGGPATRARLSLPEVLAVDAGGNLFIADNGNSAIRKVTPGGIITTAFKGPFGCCSGGLAVDAQDDIFYSDTFAHQVHKVAPDGATTTVAGNGTKGFSGDGGPATQAQLADPIALAVDAQGDLFIADNLNNRVRKVAPDGTITTVAGNGDPGLEGDGGPATQAQVASIGELAVDGHGDLFIAAEELREVTPDGFITTLATSGGVVNDVAVDARGNVYFTTNETNRVYKHPLAETITTTVADLGKPKPGQFTSISNMGLAVNARGKVFLALEKLNRVVAIGR